MRVFLMPTRSGSRTTLAQAVAAASGDGSLMFPVRDYSGEASDLFNNMRAPASLLAGALLGACFSLVPSAGDRRTLSLLKRVHLFVGLLSVSAELLAVVACTVTINKLAEVRRPPTAGVQKLLFCDSEIELAWLTANVNFFAGLFGLLVLTGLRGYMSFGGCGPFWGTAATLVTTSVGLQMASMINCAIASGDASLTRCSSGDRPGGGRSMLALVTRYHVLLLAEARQAPLAALSILCTLAATVCGMAGAFAMV